MKSERFDRNRYETAYRRLLDFEWEEYESEHGTASDDYLEVVSDFLSEASKVAKELSEARSANPTPSSNNSSPS